MARTSRLDTEPGLREEFAQKYVDGATRQELAAAYHVHQDTITRWTHDELVQALVSKYREERVNRVTRHIDARLETIVSTPELVKKLTVRDLTDIRKTLAPAPTTQTVKHGVSEDQAAAAMWQQLNENPELAQQFLGMAPAALPEPDEEELVDAELVDDH